MKKTLALLPLALYCLPIQASEPLTYHQPVSPACFSQLLHPAASVTSVNLAACANKTPVALQDGYYTAPDHQRYAVLGNDGNKYLILSQSGTGSSGYFSHVVWIENDGSTLRVIKSLASGERCNGGAEKSSNWQYYINLSPMDVVNLGSALAVKLDAYRDLDTSAASCVAKAFYQFNPKNASVKFVKMKLLNRPMAMESWVLQLNYQYCFNRLYNSYLDRGQTELSSLDLDRFKNEFEGICVNFKR